MALTETQLKPAAQRLERLNDLVRSLPEASIEDYGRQGEHRTYRIGKKTFAHYVCDHHNDGRIALWCKSTSAEQFHRVDEEPEHYFVPPYLGKSGWLGLRLDQPGEVPWDAVEYLLQQAFLAQAPKRLQRQLSGET